MKVRSQRQRCHLNPEPMGSGTISTGIPAWDLLHGKATIGSEKNFKQVNLKLIQKHIRKSCENLLDFLQVYIVSEFADSKKILL